MTTDAPSRQPRRMPGAGAEPRASRPRDARLVRGKRADARMHPAVTGDIGARDDQLPAH